MTEEKPHITIHWLKRDLRLQDNENLWQALQEDEPVILLYIFEPSLEEDVHYSERHFNFIKESLVDMNARLAAYNTKVLCVRGEVIPVFKKLQKHFTIKQVFSHVETGIKKTYDRDKAFKNFKQAEGFIWIQYINNGVQRALQNRVGWVQGWEWWMSEPQRVFFPKEDDIILGDVIDVVGRSFEIVSLETPKTTPFQK